MRRIWLIGSGAAALALALACGAGDGADVGLDGEGLPPYPPAASEELVELVVEDDVAIDASGRSAPSPGAGSDIPLVAGEEALAVCARQLVCRCGTAAHAETCVSDHVAKHGSAAISPSTAACIMALPCTEYCGAQFASCEANSGGASALGHELRMGIINNYPTGGNCSGGQTEIRDYSGGFVGCR